MGTELVDLRDLSSVDVFNAIRNELGPEFQWRITEATQANMAENFADMQKYRPQMNQFVSAFVNQIGLVVAQNISWENPLREFKRGLLTYGDTIEEYMVDLVEAHQYNHDRDYKEKELFGQHTPRVKTNFHTIDREDYYPVTIKEFVLKRAFLNDSGVSGLAGQILQAPMESDQWDEFLLMTNLFAQYERNGGFFKVKVPDLTTLSSTQAEARTVLRIMRAFIDTLKFRSRRYNAAAMSTAASPDDLVIFCTPEFRAAVDVDALAGAFNLDRTDLNARIIAIPDEYFGIDGAQAIMTTRNFFVVGDTLWQTTSQENAVGMTHNFYLHHHQIISASTFVPAVLFTTKTGDEIVTVTSPVTGITAVKVYDRDQGETTEVERGEIYNVTALGVTDNADAPNKGVRWKLAGNESIRTYVTQSGVLHVGPDETAETFKVRAITTWIDPANPQKDGKTAELTVTVTGESDVTFPEAAEITGITVEGVPVDPAFDPETLAYTVVVPGGTTTVDAIEISGVDESDYTLILNEAGDSFTVQNWIGEGDPVYTVTVN